MGAGFGTMNTVWVLALALTVFVCTSAVDTQLKPAQDYFHEDVIVHESNTASLLQQTGSAVTEDTDADTEEAGSAVADDTFAVPLQDTFGSSLEDTFDDGSVAHKKQFGSAVEALTVEIPEVVFGSTIRDADAVDGVGSALFSRKQFGSGLVEADTVAVPELVFGSVLEDTEVGSGSGN